MQGNKLFYNRVYLSGPIDNAKDFGVEWRIFVQNSLSDLDLIFLDPCNKQLYNKDSFEIYENRDHRNKLIQNRNFELLAREMREIRSIDLRLCDICDFVITYLNTNIYTTGTIEEITLLNRRKVPVLIFIEGGFDMLPNWIWGMIPYQHVFSDWNCLFEYIRYIAYAEFPIETFGRWRFIDYGTLYKKRGIRISQNKVAIVSPEDYDYLTQWNWSAVPQGVGNLKRWRAMRKLKIDGKSITRFMHQDVVLRMELEYDMVNTVIDHRDRNPLNNNRENLILTTSSINSHNRSKQTNNTTGKKGVWFNKKKK